MRYDGFSRSARNGWSRGVQAPGIESKHVGSFDSDVPRLHQPKTSRDPRPDPKSRTRAFQFVTPHTPYLLLMFGLREWAWALLVNPLNMFLGKLGFLLVNPLGDPFGRAEL